jgi:hypothetical protein
MELGKQIPISNDDVGRKLSEQVSAGPEFDPNKFGTTHMHTPHRRIIIDNHHQSGAMVNDINDQFDSTLIQHCRWISRQTIKHRS